jgi:hypothetical protein
MDAKMLFAMEQCAQMMESLDLPVDELENMSDADLDKLLQQLETAIAKVEEQS